MLGFSYREALHGGFYFLDDPRDERAADLKLDVDVKDALALMHSRTATLSGDIKLDGFAESVRADGVLIIDPDQKRVSYELSFVANDHARYRFRGHKELTLLNFADSFTLVQASLYNDRAREIGRAVVRFDARSNWASLLRSFRLRW
jgi:hypothetical protein